MILGELHLAKTKLFSLIKFCETSGRLPQLFIQWKKYEELDDLDLKIDLFLSAGKLSKSSSINKALKFLSKKEEIFYFVESVIFSAQARELLVSLTGRYHDIKALKLFLVFCILKKENSLDSIRIFLRKYPSVSRLCFNIIEEKDRKNLSKKKLKKLKKSK